MALNTSSMGHLVVYRAGRGLLTLWLVVTVAFVILRLSGDPVAMLLSDTATPDEVAALRTELGLDRPLAEQYVRYLSQVARGNLGDSIVQREPAIQLVLERIVATFQLAAVSFTFGTVGGLAIGVLSAVKRGGPADRLTMASVTAVQSAPAFLLGIVLIFVFSVGLGWLPSSGRGTWQQLVLPAVTLAVFSTTNLARMTRSSLLEVLPLDYVRTARSKGLGPAVVVRRHAFRNAALPVVTLMGLELGTLLTGAVVVETVFAWPGVGRLAIDSIGARDYPVVQAVVILMAAVFVLVNFAVDCSYAVLDPRVLHG